MAQETPGKAFETEVAEVLSLMGFQIEEQIRTAGFQADLLISKGVGPFTERYLVEIKDHLAPVGNDAVLKLGGAVTAYKSIYPSVRGLLVSRRDFTRDAKEAARAQTELRIATFDQLLDSLIDFTAYLQRYKLEYEQKSIFKLFVDPAISLDDKNHGSESVIDSLFTWLDDSESARTLLLLGEYGSGKTVSVEHLAYLLVKRVLAEGQARWPIPLIIYLKDFPRALGDLRYLITSYLVNDLGAQGKYAAFQLLLRRGRVLVIFEGFDEMAMAVDEVTRDTNFLLLQTLSTQNSRIIISGRPEYFPSESHLHSLISKDRTLHPLVQSILEGIESLPEIAKVELRLFDDDRIRSYLDKWELHFAGSDFPGRAVVVERLRSIHDLRSLASRPVLLNLIVKTLPSLLHKQGAVTAASLYVSYTEFWIRREEKKGRVLIPIHVKQAFVHELAWRMLKEGRPAIHFRELPLEIIDFFEPKSTGEWEAYDHDIRTCSYLHRDAIGNFSFTHKTFMEYFCAARIRDELTSGRSIPLAELNLTSEILQFFHDQLDDALWETIEDSIYSFANNATYRRNLLRLLARSPLPVVISSYLRCLSYWPSEEAKALERQTRRRIEKLQPSESADLISAVLRFEAAVRDDKIAKTMDKLKHLLKVDSVLVDAYAKHLRTGSDVRELLGLRRLDIATPISERITKIDSIRAAVEALTSLTQVDALLQKRRVELDDKELRRCETLRCTPRLVREIGERFDVSVEDTLTFIERLRFKEPEKARAHNVVPGKEVAMFAREIFLSPGATSEILSKTRVKRDELRRHFRTLRRRRDSEELLRQIRERSGLGRKEFNIHFSMLRAAVRRSQET